ncbi:MAG: hypothetical protein HOW73_33025 [Polyangiaceae bacterium]|nr:hypothetical protein [Polyangiaceae bacterium]
MTTDERTERERRRAAHVAWAKDRLASEWGKAQLRKNLEAGFHAVMEAPVGELFDVDRVARVVEHFTTDPFLTKSVRPLVRAAILLELSRLREDPAKLGVYVSDEARALVETLLEQPELVSPKFVEKIVAHRAFEDIARDVLDDALREFSEKVDPFRAEWGIPSLLKLGGPIAFGLGAFTKAFESVRDEFQKRLEPERKRFLKGFATRALKMVAEFVIKRNGEPQFVALRKELFSWVLEQPVSELMTPASEAVTELSSQIGHELTKHVCSMDATKRRRRAKIEMIVRAHEKQPLRQALATYGATITPNFDVLVEALWPLMAPALKTPELEAFVEGLVGDFYALEPEPSV